jgi:hypothetical protein
MTTDVVLLGYISCQFLSPGCRVVPGYVLQLLFGENRKISNNSVTTKAREKICTDLESFEFKKNLDVRLAKFRIIK